MEWDAQMMEGVRNCYCDLNVVVGGSTSSNEELVQSLANCEINSVLKLSSAQLWKQLIHQTKHLVTFPYQHVFVQHTNGCSADASLS